MSRPNHILLEGIDGVGKDTVIQGVQNRHGYHQVLHYKTPLVLDCYVPSAESSAQRQYQVDTFRTMFRLLRGAPLANVICNRAHLGESVYAPLYRGYSGEYVFELEREFDAGDLTHVRLVLLTENLDISVHFQDDRKSLGGPERRREEQMLFVRAFNASTIKDKRIVCVTDPLTGKFRSHDAILSDVLA